MKKNVIIVNNGFTDNLKESFRKFRLFNLIQGIILIIIGVTGLFFNAKIFLRLAVYVLPLLLLSYVAKTVMMAIPIRKSDFKSFVVMIIQAFLLLVSAIYVIFYPFDTLQYLVMGIGVLLVMDSVVKFIYTEGSVYPVTSTILGLLCLVFPNQLINIFYKAVLAFILIIGIFKISSATFFLRVKKEVNDIKEAEIISEKEEEN